MTLTSLPLRSTIRVAQPRHSAQHCASDLQIASDLHAALDTSAMDHHALCVNEASEVTQGAKGSMFLSDSVESALTFSFEFLLLKGLL